MKTHTLKEIGLTVVLLLLVAVLESKSALGAYNSVTDHVSGMQHAALSAVCALLAFWFSRMAGRFAIDVRPFVRRSASLARIVSIAFLIVPVTYLGAALKHDRIEREWTVYYGSPAYAADLVVAADPMADRYDREEARERIVKPSGEIAVLDGEWFVALMLQVLVITAAGIPLHRPATDEETRHWRKVEAAKRGVATRKRNAAKRRVKKPALRIVASK